MIKKEYQRFYWLSLIILSVLSAYPLVNGVRMAYLSMANGAIEPQQYAKYVVPYGAICSAIVLFAVFQPLLFRMKRLSFPVGLIGAYAVFIAIEQFLEGIQIHTAGMTLIDPVSLGSRSPTIVPSATVDAWQSSLCVVSPLTRGQSYAFILQDRYFFAMANDTYKIHYYLISLILISMVCGLVYGIGLLIRMGANDRKKPLILQGMTTAALIALCVFANTTAFFRQPEAIQTPLASILTGLFFVILGASVGVYVGSFLLKKDKGLGLGLPILLSVCSVLLMYLGEAAMMEGDLYRFGTGWFFKGLSGIALAPVDILVVLFSGIATWLILYLTKRVERWPGKRTACVVILLSVLVTSFGMVISMSQAKSNDDKLLGCYVFDACLYINPLSSFYPAKGYMTPYVYGLSEDALIIANTQTGDIQRLSARYENTAVAEDEFSSRSKFDTFDALTLPIVSQYKNRWRRAVFTDENGEQSALYQMDREIWLVKLWGKGDIWYIYRLRKTKKYTLPDLEDTPS